MAPKMLEIEVQRRLEEHKVKVSLYSISRDSSSNFNSKLLGPSAPLSNYAGPRASAYVITYIYIRETFSISTLALTHSTSTVGL